MKRLILAALLTLIAFPLQAAEKPMTDEQKTLYVVGTNVARSLAVFSLTDAELDTVLQGLRDSRAGKKPDFDITAYTPKMQELARARRKALGEKQAAGGEAYLEKAAQSKNAVKTDSGLVYVPLVEGKGVSPKATDTVKVNYRGALIDGSEFDSSYKRNKPLEFKLNGVIACWTEGVQKMKAGGKARLVCPPTLAYGDNGAGDLILPGATLDFEVELLEVNPVSAAAKPDSPKPVKPAEPAGK
jgi:FKBP-type peptidyl-prolyl cis-trans isomerase FkpA